MTDETKPKIENLKDQEAEELTPEAAEQAQGGVGLSLPPPHSAPPPPAQKQ